MLGSIEVEFDDALRTCRVGSSGESTGDEKRGVPAGGKRGLPDMGDAVPAFGLPAIERRGLAVNRGLLVAWSAAVRGLAYGLPRREVGDTVPRLRETLLSECCRSRNKVLFRSSSCRISMSSMFSTKLP
eukprot:TRINITY_DN19018_c0_g1_i1.p3 TRINITY_DN19018_c0_g1~~TRINITY_DN19018_c0_g1_i1.p3  ORF type:complete len:129 (-),score=20.32 TRINITY_DN19018_c0_g1_i1:441-827(-)